jgi:hypothetical protein
MNARTELFVYLGTAIATVIGLFTLQIWYASYLDVNVVHAQRGDTPLDAKVAAIRAEERRKLDSGRTPIAAAKREIAQRGRGSLARIAPKQSTDLTPMSGWIHRPGFAAYEPRTQPAPQAEAAQPAPGAEGGEQAATAAAQPASAQQPAAPAGSKAP